MEWSFASAGPIEANVEVPSGLVDVQPVSRDGIEVSLEPRHPTSRRAMELVEASKVSFDNGRLHVHVPSRTFKNAEILCTIVLPEGSALVVKTASAVVRCSGKVGDLSATVASGDITLEDVEGELVVATASGDLQCRSVASRLKVKGASSDVTIGRVGGPVDISLASGDVEIGDAATSLRVHTASGDLHLCRAHEGEIVVRNASGDITIGVAPGISAYLDIASMSGDMSCTLPFEETSAAEAKLQITCQSMSGDVRIEAASA